MGGMSDQPALKRTLTLPQVMLFGLGTILGAGIYVLVGEVAATAGLWAPASFLIAALLAALTGLSFAELSSRFPLSGGAAIYVQQAFGRPNLSVAIGLLVVLTEIVSSATLVNGFAGYFREFQDIANIVIVPVVCLCIGSIAAWRITQSVGTAVAITFIEVLGLAVVVAVALPDAIGGEALAVVSPALALEGTALWLGVMSGAGIAFYAFIGFEDMVNVAEEVKDARRVMPRAVILALLIATLIYVIVTVVVIRAMPISELAVSEAPLAAIFERATGRSAAIISLIALFAVINGAFIQVVMASRVLYGSAAQGLLPNFFHQVHPKTQTPVNATVIVTGLILIFALWLPLGTLARLTSLIILIIFVTVNAALVYIKVRAKSAPKMSSEEVETIYEVPFWIPVAGAFASAVFVLINLSELMG